MINSYYTLSALASEWSKDLVGATLTEAYSQVRDELSLVFESGERVWTVRISTRSPFLYAFRAEGYSKARKNVATLFEEACGNVVTAVRVADRDRMLFFDLQDGSNLQILLFGPNANVFHVTPDGLIGRAFRLEAEWEGKPAPDPKPASEVVSLSEFAARWRSGSKSMEQAVAGAVPLFNRTLATEVVFRAGLGNRKPADCTPEELEKLFEAVQEVRADLAHATTRIYWNGRRVDVFSLVELRHLAEREVELFGSVDEAVRVFVRRSLAQRRFDELYNPLERTLKEAATRYRKAVENMLEELAHESRADRYERYAHLLMASAGDDTTGREEVTLPDLFAGGEPVTIPVNPALSKVENAKTYYARARRTRQARQYAEERLIETERMASLAESLLESLQKVTSVSALEQFRRDLESNEEASRLLRSETKDQARIPFRRFDLPGGYEVWVGKNAQQNDRLTMHYAQKHDYWMHARGVSGSHVLLRRPSRTVKPGRDTLEQAASIAAYFSKAKGSGLVPVSVTERKYVRKPKGALPGAVVLDREEVLLVEPRLPQDASDEKGGSGN